MKVIIRGQQALRVSVLALSVIAGGAAVAQSNGYCTGTINYSWIDKDGNFYVFPTFSGNHLMVCNVKATRVPPSGVSWTTTVDATTCLGWVSLVRQAQTTGKPMTFLYTNPVPPLCSGLIPSGTDWYEAAPVPHYVMIRPY